MSSDNWPREGRKPLREYWTRAVALGLSLLVVAVVLFVVASHQKSTTAQSVWSAAGSGVGTVGLFSILYDAFLKNSLLKDLFRFLGVSERMQAAGFQDISLFHTKFDWQAMFDRASWVRVLPLQPNAWMRHEWPSLLAACERRSIHVRLYVAESLRTGDDGTDEPGERLAVQAGAEWERHQPALHKESQLEVLTYRSGEPHVGYLMTDQDVVLTVPSALGPAPDSQIVAFAFAAPNDSSVRHLATRAFDNLPELHTAEKRPTQPGPAATRAVLAPVTPPNDDRTVPTEAPTKHASAVDATSSAGEVAETGSTDA
ncbi:MAG: hypothetical protein QOD07_2695 [Frankiaceae bacterium]|jgi:hypothetical protein|nr:hypothetical protein [Frankiaceae bacterium]